MKALKHVLGTRCTGGLHAGEEVTICPMWPLGYRASDDFQKLWRRDESETEPEWRTGIGGELVKTHLIIFNCAGGDGLLAAPCPRGHEVCQ
jgi:hypothetical protein